MDKAFDYVDQLVTSGAVPGAALAVSRGGELTQRYWNVEQNTPHMLLSFTKAISVTAICEAKPFDLDDLVATYIPQYASGGKESTTIRHLLTHTAGIPNAGYGWALDSPGDWSRAIEAVCAATAEYEPGTKSMYHGLSGLLVAGEVVRRVTGEPFRAIVDRLGFAATWDPPDNVVVTHSMGLRGARWQPAGGMFGTARDVIAVLDHHLAHRDRYPEMHRVQYPHLEPWAVGWLLRGTGELSGNAQWLGLTDECSPEAFSHAGGATVHGLADPSSRTSLAFLTTATPSGGAAQTMEARAAVTSLVLAS